MFTYKKKRCYIKPVGKLFIGLSHWAPGVPYVQKYTVDGPGYVAWSPGIGKAFARKAKDARRTLQEAIDNQPHVLIAAIKVVLQVGGVYRG